MVMKNLTKQYRTTYDSNGKMFSINREGAGLPNMEILIHDSGLHYYEPPKKDLAILKSVSTNKEDFSLTGTWWLNTWCGTTLFRSACERHGEIPGCAVAPKILQRS